MLKTKAGEINALDNLTPATKQRVLPVFHVTTTVSARFAPALGAVWAGNALAVDGSFSFNTGGSTAPFNALIRALRQAGVVTLPSIAINADPRLIAAAAAFVGPDGLLVRTTLTNLVEIQAWVQAHGWAPAQIDLLIDVGHVAAIPSALLAPVIANAIAQNIGPNSPYRSVSLVAASAPKDHGDLPRGRSNVLRADWALWQAVAPQVPFQLDYADYCSGHPDLTEPPGVAMASATVSARYTGQAHWLVIKGRSTGGAQGIPMEQQYRSHAAHYVGDPQFGGLLGCWADNRIRQINARATGPGNRQSWSEIAANRHIEMTVSQLP
jgi:hypothetical protein